MKLNNNVYNILKWLSLYVLPAFCTLYLSLSGIWGWPYAEQIIGTITSVETFIGVVIGISSYNYGNSADKSDKK